MFDHVTFIINEVIDYALQFLNSPPLFLFRFLDIKVPLQRLRLINFLYEMPNESVELLCFLGIHGLLHLALVQFAGHMHVVPHARQGPVDLRLAGQQIAIALFIDLQILYFRIIAFIIRLLS